MNGSSVALLSVKFTCGGATVNNADWNWRFTPKKPVSKKTPYMSGYSSFATATICNYKTDGKYTATLTLTSNDGQINTFTTVVNTWNHRLDSAVRGEERGKDYTTPFD